jgi:hypothetical protein
MSNKQGVNNRIQAVIFDYGGVLMRTVDPVLRRELEQRFGLPPGGMEKLMSEGSFLEDVQLGCISGAEFLANVGQRLGLNARDWQSSGRLSRLLTAACWPVPSALRPSAPQPDTDPHPSSAPLPGRRNRRARATRYPQSDASAPQPAGAAAQT